MDFRFVSVGAIVAIVLLVVGGLSLKSVLSSSTPVKTASVQEATSSNYQPNPDDIQIDNQGDGQVIATYRADLSSSQAIFDLELKSSSTDLFKYNYSGNIVLADTDINLLSGTVKQVKVSGTEGLFELITPKYPGTHFHLIVHNFAGIKDRVLHFYRKI